MGLPPFGDPHAYRTPAFRRGLADPTPRPLNADAVVPCCMLSFPGTSSATGPESSVTSCPAPRAAAATAYPIFPLDALVRKRTGSKYSRVGPAVIRTRITTDYRWSQRG